MLVPDVTLSANKTKLTARKGKIYWPIFQLATTFNFHNNFQLFRDNTTTYKKNNGSKIWIAQFRYFKIQPKTIEITTTLLGKKTHAL